MRLFSCGLVCLILWISKICSGISIDHSMKIDLDFHAVFGKIIENECAYGGMIHRCRDRMELWLKMINEDVLKFNVLIADFAWKTSVGDNGESVPITGIQLDKLRSKWRKIICESIGNINLSLLDDLMRRQVYLLCRGVSFTEKEAEVLDKILDQMQTIYTTTKVCVLKNESISVLEDQIIQYLSKVQKYNIEKSDAKKFNNSQLSEIPYIEMETKDISDAAIWESAKLYGKIEKIDNVICLSGEPDLEKLMANSKSEKVLKWAWLVWREAVGPPMKPLYIEMVSLKNRVAKRNGYHDIGEIWREELEIPNLIQVVDDLFQESKELYALLHGVTKHFLEKTYFRKVRSNGGLIEAHLMGNLWAQSWEAIISLIVDIPEAMNLDMMIKKTNWTSKDMVKRAEDFYSSLGLPPMTEKFWKFSFLGNNDTNSRTKCHGTAANMFLPGDYRMIYCAGLSLGDFYVIHHEMGHLQYYMSYEYNLPTIFQDGTNSAFQESIGDAIMLGVMSPQHLERLSLINDQILFTHPKATNLKTSKTSNLNKNNKKYKKYHDDEIKFDDILLLYQGLTKIPQVPFGYTIEKYRWDIFSEKIKPNNYNREFWRYTMKYQGIEPPNGIKRNEIYFDAGAKFHIPDNTPYIRYFLSSFLQVQLFKGMCQWTLYGSVNPKRKLPMPLHRCDIYGSKRAGEKLREIMSKGSSIKWSEALYHFTGENKISSSAFLEYFEPLKKFLKKIIQKHNVKIGWKF